MQGMIRCGLIAGLLIACHTSDPGTPDAPNGSGASGMHVTWASDPTPIPGNVENWLTLESATFAFDNLRVIGDAGPGDPRTTATTFPIKWDATTSPAPIDFPDAPTGLYSKVSFQIDGHLTTSSVHLKGQVDLGGTWVPYKIEDGDALSLSLDINRTLDPGGSQTIGLLVKFHDALTSIDFSTLPFDDGALQLETGDPQMTPFRDKLTLGFTIDSTGTN